MIDKQETQGRWQTERDGLANRQTFCRDRLVDKETNRNRKRGKQRPRYRGREKEMEGQTGRQTSRRITESRGRDGQTDR